MNWTKFNANDTKYANLPRKTFIKNAMSIRPAPMKYLVEETPENICAASSAINATTLAKTTAT